MNINQIGSVSNGVEQQKALLKRKLEFLLTKAVVLDYEHLDLVCEYDNIKKPFNEHIKDFIRVLNEHHREIDRISQDEFLQEEDLEFFEDILNYFESQKSNYLSTNTGLQINLPSINETIDDGEFAVPQMSELSLNLPQAFEVQAESTQLQIANIETNQKRILQKIDALTKDAKDEASNETKLKMRKWRWLAVAQLPASYPYAAEAYEFYKPYAIDAFNKTVEIYNVYAPIVIETVSEWFN